MTELKFAKLQEICTTLSYVAFTHSESRIGDAMLELKLLRMTGEIVRL